MAPKLSRRLRTTCATQLRVAVITMVLAGAAGTARADGGAAPIVDNKAPRAVVGVPLKTSIKVSGGSGPYKFELIAGMLPSGLTLAKDGTITGTAALPGPFSFTVRVSNSGSLPASVNQSYVMYVQDRPDPALDPNTIALVNQQASTARRFAMAQMTNLQTRLVSLRSINEGRCFEAPARPSLAPPPGNAQKRTTLLGTELLDQPQPQPEQSFSMPLENCRTLPDRATTLWSAGSLNVGAGEQGGASPFRFDSQGITLGGDIGVRPNLSFGAGVGVARDETLGLPAGGSSTGSNGNAVTGYVSYRPVERVYLEAVIGVGEATMESARIAGTGDEMNATRRGDQRFVSVSAGHRFGYSGWQVVPYTRVDHVRATLRSVNEAGAGGGALSYSDEKVPSLGWTAGYAAEASFVTSIGTIAPRTSLEYRRELERSDPGSVRYADDPGAASYSLVPNGLERNSTTLGLGANLMMTSRWSFGLGGTINRSTASSSTRVDATVSRVF